MRIDEEISLFYKKNFIKTFFTNHSPSIDKQDLKEIQKVIKSTFVSTVGREVNVFANLLKKITKSKYILPVNTGTSALHLSLVANEINNEHEVLVPSLNFVAAVNSILYTGASPHFVDVNRKNLSVDFDLLDNYLKNFIFKNNTLINPKTKKKIKALILLHTFGYAADLDEAKKVCKKYNLLLIEDAAEAIGTYYKNIHVGNFGICGILSFNGNKVITTGAGGAIITNNKKFYNRISHLSKVAKANKPFVFEFDNVGYNYRMPNINASLGIGQIKKLNKLLNQKKKLHKKYLSFFKKNKNIRLLVEKISTISNHWLNTIIIEKDKINKSFQTKLLKKLNKNNIQIRPLWSPLHKQKYLTKYPKMNLKNTEYLEFRVYNLPSSPNLIMHERTKPNN